MLTSLYNLPHIMTILFWLIAAIAEKIWPTKKPMSEESAEALHDNLDGHDPNIM